MHVDEAASLDDAIFVDVREHGEWDAGHIDGAIHVPIGQITARVGEFDPGSRYIAVCRSGARSAQVTGFLRTQGVDMHNLEGGMQAWARAALPMVAEHEGAPFVA